VNQIAHQSVDIYAPCALGGEFDTRSVKRLHCKAVVGGANNQLVDARAGAALHARGIVYVPDYIANAGGLIYVADELEPGGFSQERVRSRVAGIESTVADMLTRSQQTSKPPGEIADTIALERVAAGRPT
jgi:glutamate dehydrogenase/leucine dehydrogenase